MKIIFEQLESNTHLLMTENRAEWQFLTIDEKKGLVMSYGTLGKFGYVWRSIGETSIREFLTSCEYDYAMVKLHDEHGYYFDGDKMIDAIKLDIKKQVKEGHVSKDQAKLALDELEMMAEDIAGYAADHFYIAIDQSDALATIYPSYQDLPPAQQTRKPQCELFWQMLQAFLKSEKIEG